MLLRNETSTPSADMAAPRGRPPAGHRYVDGVFVHAETGIPFDPELHAGLAHAKKLACLQAHYWQRGGRAKRLQRYAKKCRRRRTQLTLEESMARPARGAPTSHAEKLSELADRPLRRTVSEWRTSYTCPHPACEPARGTSSQPTPAI